MSPNHCICVTTTHPSCPVHGARDDRSLEDRFVDANLRSKQLADLPDDNKIKRWWTAYYRHQYRLIMIRARFDNTITEEVERWMAERDSIMEPPTAA